VCSVKIDQTKGADHWNTTYYPTLSDKANNIKPWYIIDAKGKTLGRLAALAASYIRGKNSATYHPANDMGSYVIVINAEHVQVTGKKFDDKYYFNHTQNKRSGAGRIGGYRIEHFKDLQKRYPEKIIEEAVYGMLPKGRLGKEIRVKHLKVRRGPLGWWFGGIAYVPG
jgi:large subunit ribosomal protein L13